MKKSMIIVHASFTPASMDIGVKEIRSWHKARGWRDVGYATIIRRSGAIELGRDIDGDGDVFDDVGAHTLGMNKASIGICLVGGRGADGKPDANFTLAQYTALKHFVAYLRVRYPTIVTVVGHREASGNRECPYFDVAALLS